MSTDGSYSAHLVGSYMAAQSPRGPFGQPLHISTHGPMSFAPQMHGSFGSSPGGSAFGTQFSMFSDSSFMDMSEESAKKIATLQAKLDKRLGPEYISQRPGPGGGPKLTYAEGTVHSLHDTLRGLSGCSRVEGYQPRERSVRTDRGRRSWGVLTSTRFGFNGWSSSVVSITVDFIDFSEESRRFNVGVTAIVRVTLRDGVFHEDVGYGLLENSKSKGAALDKVRHHTSYPRPIVHVLNAHIVQERGGHGWHEAITAKLR